MFNKEKNQDTTIIVDGKPTGVRNFTFENVSLTVKVDKTEKVLLKDVTGSLKAGEMTAIMGGSGAGKSTLLNTLAGRIESNTHLTGSIMVDGHERYPSTWKQQCGYVEQDDLMFENLTVYETLLYSARLRVEGLTRSEKIERVNKVIAELGLEGCRNTKIGSAMSRGISGGERKRVSIGVELVADPEILFLDEPTSGLDAFNAFNVMETLKKLARDYNKIILLSIHQPRTDILDLFDKVILLSQGQLCWIGSTHDAIDHFEYLGYPMPAKTNPSDFFLDTITIDRRSDELYESSKSRIEKFFAAYRALPKEHPVVVKQPKESKHAKTHWSSTWVGEFWTLTDRNLLNDWRDPAVIGATIGSNLFSMFLISILFTNAPNTSAGVQNRLGAFFFICLNLAFGVIGPSVQKFPAEKAIIKRERASGAYRSSAAFMAKYFGSLPLLIIGTTLFVVPIYWTIGFQATYYQFFSYYVICLVHVCVSNALGFVIGAIAPNADIGALITPLFLIVFMLFSGLMINLNTITVVLRWIQWVSYVTYTYKALGQNEFNAAIKFTCAAGEQCFENGLAVVNQYSIGNPGLWTSVIINAGFVGFYLAVGMLIFNRTSAPLAKLK